VGHWSFRQVRYANLILHQQPLRTRAYSIALAHMPGALFQILYRGAPPCHDHRIMLDVEFDPGPSLLSFFRVLQEQRPSRGMTHSPPCLESCVRVAIAQDRAFGRDVLP
jgi:hypothetical protein